MHTHPVPRKKTTLNAIGARLRVLAAAAILLGPVTSHSQAPSATHVAVREALDAAARGQADRLRSQWTPSRTLPANRPRAALVLATLDRATYQTEKAESAYKFIVASGAPDAELQAHATLGLAALYWQNFQLKQASEQYSLARVRFGARRDSIGGAESLLGLSGVALRTTGIADAQRYVAQAQSLAPKWDTRLKAGIGCADVRVRVRSRLPVNDSMWHSRRAAAEAGGPRVVSECLLARAEALDARGVDDSALVVLDSLYTVQNNARMWSALAATQQRAGYQLSALGRYAESRTALLEAISLGKKSGSISSEGWANLNLAALSQRIGAWSDAEQYSAKALAALKQADDRAGMLFAHNTRAEGELLRGDLVRANANFLEMTDEVALLAPQLLVSRIVSRAEIARRQGRINDARHLLDSAVSIAHQKQMSGWNIEVAYQRALLAMRTGAFDTASALLKSLVRNSTIPPPAQYEILARLAEAEAGAQRLDEAERQIRLAMARLDESRAKLTHRDLVLTVLQERHLDWDSDLGLATVIARLSQAGRQTTALEIADWRRARLLEREVLKRGALGGNDESRNGGVPLRAPVGRPARGTAVIAYVTGAGGEPTTAFVHASDSLLSFQLAPVDSLSEIIERFTALLTAGRLSESVSRRLGATLVEPLLAALPIGTRRLIIIPDGSLHRLPFAALMLANSQMLAERFELATAPSATVAVGGLERAQSSSNINRSGVLAVGAPTRLPEFSTGAAALQPLPGASVEMRQIEKMVRGSTVLSGSLATIAAFQNAVREGGSVLHIATHAQAADASLDGSGLAFEPDAASDGVLRPSAVAAMTLPFDLVVLSGCETAEGMLLAGEGLQGLTGAVLEAGSRAVIATRWRLNDNTSGNFIYKLYERFLAGDDAVAALAYVRRDAIKHHESPALWANLEFVGDPSVAVLGVAADAKHGGRKLPLILSAALGLIVLGLYLRSRNNRTPLRR